jgi:hypothetical protein
MHVDQTLLDLRGPQAEKMSRGATGREDSPCPKTGLEIGEQLLTSAHIDALTRCLQSIHSSFDIFLSFDVKVVRSLPIFHFVRSQ